MSVSHAIQPKLPTYPPQTLCLPCPEAAGFDHHSHDPDPHQHPPIIITHFPLAKSRRLRPPQSATDPPPRIDHHSVLPLLSVAQMPQALPNPCPTPSLAPKPQASTTPHTPPSLFSPRPHPSPNHRSYSPVIFDGLMASIKLKVNLNATKVRFLQ